MTAKKEINSLIQLLNIRILLSVLVVINGLWLTLPVLVQSIGHFGKDTTEFVYWMQTLGFLHLLELPRFTLGATSVLFGIFLARRARIAWIFTIFILLVLTILDLILGVAYLFHGIYSFTLFVLLLRFWRHFPQHSATNTAVVALFSIAALIFYSVLGTLYLGQHFTPKVINLFDAFYFSMVSMTTVGYGDIIPVSVASRTFTISVVLFGITIFTTSVVYLVGVAAHGTREIVQKRLSQMKDHYVVVGSSVLARYVYKGLRERDIKTVVVCDKDSRNLFPADAVVVTGDASEISTLDEASVGDASHMMALNDNDVDNTYVLLAAKEVAGERVKTVTVINEERNRKKLQLLHPNYVFSITEMGGEILMKYLSGENINNEVIADLLINHIQER